MNNYILGNWGELKALKHLEKSDYKLLNRNYRCPLGEIDLICQKEDSLIFIEVKTRNSSTYGLPVEAITPKKLRHIKRTIDYYLMVHFNKVSYTYLRFDVIEILQIKEKYYIHHIENACPFDF